MGDVEKKRVWEKRVVSEMIELHCRKQHADRPKDERGLCPECAALDDYARSRSDHCPFMETKAFCANCRVHCYKPDMREKIRAVMRFSGPRMMLYHPVDAVRHLVLNTLEKRRMAREDAEREAERATGEGSSER